MSRDSGAFVGHYACVASEFGHKHDCSSSDGLAVYQHTDEEGEVYYDGFCWSCKQTFFKDELHNSSVGAELGIENGIVVDKTKVKTKPQKEPLTKEQVIQFIKDTGYVSHGYRGLKDEYNRFYGHLTKLDDFGKPVAQFYPETNDGVVTGYKARYYLRSLVCLIKG